MTEHNNPQDNVTVPRELLRQAYAEIRHLSRMANVDHTERSIIGELRTALDQPEVEHAAEIVSVVTHPNAKGIRFTHHGLSLPIGTKLFAAPQAQPAVEPFGWIKSSEIESSARFGGSINLWRSQYDCDVPVFTAPQAQQPIGWLRAVDEEMVSAHLGVADITDSYEDAKRKLNTLICWHVDVSHDLKVNEPAQQPRKAVKLTPEEMKAAVEHAWRPARIDAAIEMYGHEYRAIEQAVLKRTG